MNQKTSNPLTIYLVLSVVSGLSVLSFAANEPETNTEADRHYAKAYALRKAADYDGAIAEYEQVIRLSPNSKIAQDAQYRIGQSHFESKKFDAALSVFQDLLDTYPASSIAPPTKQMIERVQQAKKNHALFEAVRKGNIDQVTLLISEGADLNERDPNGQSVLNYAVIAGHRDVVALLIEKGADINGKGRQGSAPLHEAANAGHKEVAQLLIDKGADINILKGEGPWTPLHSACKRGHTDVAELLAAKGADVNAKGLWTDDTPFYYALWNRDFDTARVLVTHEADLNCAPSKDWPPLYYFLSSNDRELVEWIVEKGCRAPAFHLAAYMGDLEKVKNINAAGADIDERDQINWTPLHWVALGCQRDIAEFLIRNGADVSAEGKGGETPLHQAARTGAKELITFLLSEGANVNAMSGNRHTPLHRASSYGRQEAVKLLISKGADIDIKNGNGETPLYKASAAGRHDVVTLLVANGADINAKTTTSRTPLYVASSNGYKETVEFLIAKGADVNTPDYWGGTAVMQAKERGHSAIVALLRQHGAQETLQAAVTTQNINTLKRLISEGHDVNARDSEGQSPLYLAARGGQKEMVEVLIANGADVNAKNDDDQTVLHVVLDIRHPVWYSHRSPRSKEMIALLLAKGADVNLKDGNSRTPLHLAAEVGAGEIIPLLLDEGAKIDGKDGESGSTALHHAARFGNQDEAEVLITQDADINATDNQGRTPLHLAVNHDYSVAELLISKGADSTIRAESGQTLLELAQQRKQIESESPDMILDGIPNSPVSIRSACGDVDGDGYDDILIGMGFYDNRRGRVSLFYGGPDMDTTADLILEGQNTGDFFGLNVKCGDIDNDGNDDIVITAGGYRKEAGRAYLYWGSDRHSMDANPDKIFAGEQEPGSRFGRGRVTVYDIDNNGHDDIILREPGARDSAVRAYLYYGKTKALMNVSPDLIFTGGNFIYGDIDNDGHGDRVMGGPGRAYLNYGDGQANMDTKADHIFEVEPRGGLMCADLNQNGCDDVVVGDTRYNALQGRAFLFYGDSKRHLNADPDIVFEGEVEGSYYGDKVICGDIDGDQMNDLIISASFYRHRLGRVYIYWGNELSGPNPKPGRVLTGKHLKEHFGNGLACGDVNNDGFDDLVIGTSSRKAGTRRVYLYYGGPRNK